jgi:hypothetical protein
MLSDVVYSYDAEQSRDESCLINNKACCLLMIGQLRFAFGTHLISILHFCVFLMFYTGSMIRLCMKVP